MERYVSTELTHFVGKSKPEEEQYVLLKRILTTGWLVPSTNEYSETAATISIDLTEKFSENKMYSPSVVCFCDIPVNDLGIHMKKYSRFGLSFLKSFLVQKGANPVFYIAKDSIIMGGMPQSAFLDQIAKQFFEFFNTMYDRLQNKDDDERLNKIRATLSYFFINHFFCFLKAFDQGRKDDDPENYYMEREWRKLSGLNFNLSDVRRVIIPESYAVRFRKDIPDYTGQITFG